MNSREKIEQLRDELCNEYCPSCQQNCCMGRFNPEVESSSFFHGIPYLDAAAELAEHGAECSSFLIKPKVGKVRLGGRCPYLDEEMKCAIHSEPERPRDCMEYPLNLRIIPSFPFPKKVIQAEKSCPIFDHGENCIKVLKLGEELGLKVNFV